MNVCFLEVSPTGPLPGKHREEIIDFFGDNYYFVTHDDEHPDALSYNKGHTWAKNRNYLAKNVPRKYDYYWFTDYDVQYDSSTSLSVCEQIIQDLETMNPAVMVCHDEQKVKSNHGGVPYSGKPFSNIMMSNNQMKIVHSSLIDWFFPLPTVFGGIWDACHFFNVLETPFIKSVICTYNVTCQGLVSDVKSQGGDMTSMHNELNKVFANSLPNDKNHAEFKRMFQSAASRIEPSQYTPGSIDVNRCFDVQKLNKIR